MSDADTSITEPAGTPLDAVTAEPIFTPAQIREDGQNRVAKTGMQAGGLAAPLLVLVVAFLHWQGMLHGTPDTGVLAAAQAVLTTAFAALMNLRRLRAR